MILSRYIFREILKSQLVIILILLLVFVSQSMIKLISRAAVGTIPVDLIGSLTMYALPDILSIMLPLTLYIAILITLGRICTDSEMVVIRSVGFPPRALLRITFVLAVITAVASGLCSIVFSPQAANLKERVLEMAQNSPAYLPLESGRFVNFGPYNIYAEHIDSGEEDDNGGQEQDLQDIKSIQNIYVMTQSDDETENTITVARQGFLEIDRNGVQWLFLLSGRRYEGPVASDGSFRMANFEKFRAPVGVSDDADVHEADIAAMSMPELMNSENMRARVEAQWRIAPVLAVLVLSLVAVPLSQVNPRQGRFARLLPALIIYATYYMLLMSIRNLVTTERYPLYPGLYTVPIAFLLVVSIPLNLQTKAIRRLMAGE